MSDRMRNYVKYFFNCRLSQAISYFKNKNTPIDTMFYNCYLSTDQVYRQTVSENKRLWQCDFPLDLSQLHFFGFEEEKIYFDQFSDFQYFLHKSLMKGDWVFVTVDPFYLKYRKFETHSLHSVVVMDVVIKDQKTSYMFQDFDPDFYGEIDSEQFHLMVNNPTMDKITISLFKFNHNVFENNYLILSENFKQYLQKHSDNFSLYESFINSLKEVKKNNTILDCYDQAFSLISGSRLLFSKFLNEINYKGQLYNDLIVVSELSFNIKMILLKAKITGNLSIGVLQEKCLLLLEKEVMCLELLKNNWREIENHISIYNPINKWNSKQLINAYKNNQIISMDSDTAVIKRMENFIKKFIECDKVEDLNEFVTPGYKISPLKAVYQLITIEDVIPYKNTVEFSLLLKDSRTKWNFPQRWEVKFSWIEQTPYITSVEILEEISN